jgi:hypothetical protein
MFAALALGLGMRATLAQIDAPAAERLMRSSGLWEQLGATAAGARAGIEAAARSQLTPLNVEEVQRLLKATDAALAPEALRSAVRDAIAARVKPAHLGSVEAWLQGDLGRRITALEVAASRPDRDSDRVIRSGIRRLAEAPDSRKKVIESLVEATRAAESITDMTIHVAIAVQRGMAGVRREAPVPPVDALRERFAAQRPSMLQAYRGMSQALFAEMYQALSDAELAQYLDFLRSEAGWHFLEATMQATELALLQAAERLGSALPAMPRGPTT